MLSCHYLIKPLHSAEKAHADGCPYQSHHTFCRHSPVKDLSSLFLIFQTTGHQGRLCGMKTRYSSTCDGNEHHRENRETFLIVMEISVLNMKFKTQQNQKYDIMEVDLTEIV
jgi:hypothetical protein